MLESIGRAPLRGSSVPYGEVHLALYLQHLSKSTGSVSTVHEAVNAISWVNQLAGHSPIAGSPPLVSATLAGLKRALAKPKVKKEPITVEMLPALVHSLSVPPSFSELRLAASYLLAFAAFLCYDELAKLRCCDFAVSESRMSIHTSSSKTDQYQQDNSVMVARTSSPTCPVARMKKYFVCAQLSCSSNLLLFRGITRTKNGER